MIIVVVLGWALAVGGVLAAAVGAWGLSWRQWARGALVSVSGLLAVLLGAAMIRA